MLTKPSFVVAYHVAGRLVCWWRLGFVKAVDGCGVGIGYWRGELCGLGGRVVQKLRRRYEVQVWFAGAVLVW
jgi:hypothetical protein